MDNMSLTRNLRKKSNVITPKQLKGYLNGKALKEYFSPSRNSAEAADASSSVDSETPRVGYITKAMLVERNNVLMREVSEKDKLIANLEVKIKMMESARNKSKCVDCDKAVPQAAEEEREEEEDAAGLINIVGTTENGMGVREGEEKVEREDATNKRIDSLEVKFNKFQETVSKGFENLTNALNQSNRMPVVPNFASITQQQQQQQQQPPQQQQQQQPPQQQQQQMTQQQGYQPNSSTPVSQQINQIGSIQQQQLETGTQVRQTTVVNQQRQAEGRYIRNREYFQDMRQERKKCMIIFGLVEFEELKTDEAPTWDLYRAEQILKEMDQEYLCEKNIMCHKAWEQGGQKSDLSELYSKATWTENLQ
ncbi:unnamed protein product [Meganyctiphanes norvegica]|uniref:Uncharacterized protein n=1 Tax=Meganyctiphanes norvegica TaxID=48144 RepID=A0AAV2RN26_MEGNR